MQHTTKRIAVTAMVAAAVFSAVAAVATAGPKGTYNLRGNSITIDEDKGLSRTDGSLIGMWQTLSFKTTAEGLTLTDGELGPPYQYAAAGTEQFTGCHDRNGNKKCEANEKGKLKLTFTYWGTYDVTTGALITGQCQHPIVGGTGAFKGARGVVYMRDTPTADGVTTVYTGSLVYGGVAARSISSSGVEKGCGGGS